MTVKVIALQRIHKTEPGGELELAENVANVLVLLKKARYVDEPKAEERPKPRRGRPPKAAQQAPAEPAPTAPPPEPQEPHAIGAIATTSIRDPGE